MNILIRIIGNIVVYTFLAGVIIICAELIWYRLPDRGKEGPWFRKKGEKKAPPVYTDIPEKRIALITGASGGLGAACAQLLDRELTDIDEIWLVARRGVRLREMASGMQHKTRCLAWDLTGEDWQKELKELLAWEEAEVGWLINCAGVAKIGSSDEMTAQVQTDMTALNCSAAVALTACCLPHMQAGDHIVNICSTAGFQPLQKLAVYSASKAYLLRYSRALRFELLSRRICVTAVCPYWIKDTEFISTAEGKGEQEKPDGIRSYPFASTVQSVAKLTVLGSRIGLPVVTPGIFCTVHRAFSKLLSDTVLVYVWEGIRRL